MEPIEYTEASENMLNTKIRCPICLQAAMRPVTPVHTTNVKCDVAICHYCLVNWCKEYHKCPQCASHIAGIAAPNTLLMALLSDVSARCRFCGATGPLGEMLQSHHKTCFECASARIDLSHGPHTCPAKSGTHPGSLLGCNSTQCMWVAEVTQMLHNFPSHALAWARSFVGANGVYSITTYKMLRELLRANEVILRRWLEINVVHALTLCPDKAIVTLYETLVYIPHPHVTEVAEILWNTFDEDAARYVMNPLDPFLNHHSQRLVLQRLVCAHPSAFLKWVTRVLQYHTGRNNCIRVIIKAFAEIAQLPHLVPEQFNQLCAHPQIGEEGLTALLLYLICQQKAEKAGYECLLLTLRGYSWLPFQDLSLCCAFECDTNAKNTLRIVVLALMVVCGTVIDGTKCTIEWKELQWRLVGCIQLVHELPQKPLIGSIILQVLTSLLLMKHMNSPCAMWADPVHEEEMQQQICEFAKYILNTTPPGKVIVPFLVWDRIRNTTDMQLAEQEDIDRLSRIVDLMMTESVMFFPGPAVEDDYTLVCMSRPGHKTRSPPNAGTINHAINLACHCGVHPRILYDVLWQYVKYAYFERGSSVQCNLWYAINEFVRVSGDQLPADIHLLVKGIWQWVGPPNIYTFLDNLGNNKTVYTEGVLYNTQKDPWDGVKQEYIMRWLHSDINPAYWHNAHVHRLLRLSGGGSSWLVDIIGWSVCQSNVPLAIKCYCVKKAESMGLVTPWVHALQCLMYLCQIDDFSLQRIVSPDRTDNEIDAVIYGFLRDLSAWDVHAIACGVLAVGKLQYDPQQTSLTCILHGNSETPVSALFLMWCLLLRHNQYNTVDSTPGNIDKLRKELVTLITTHDKLSDHHFALMVLIFVALGLPEMLRILVPKCVAVRRGGIFTISSVIHSMDGVFQCAEALCEQHPGLPEARETTARHAQQMLLTSTGDQPCYRLFVVICLLYGDVDCVDVVIQNHVLGMAPYLGDLVANMALQRLSRAHMWPQWLELVKTMHPSLEWLQDAEDFGFVGVALNQLVDITEQTQRTTEVIKWCVSEYTLLVSGGRLEYPDYEMPGVDGTESFSIVQEANGDVAMLILRLSESGTSDIQAGHIRGIVDAFRRAAPCHMLGVPMDRLLTCDLYTAVSV